MEAAVHHVMHCPVRKIKSVIFFMLVCLVSCPAMGQAKQKKALTQDQYALWHQLFMDKFSEHGNWISYLHHYKTGSDTLFVTHTRTKRTFTLPNGTKSAFIGETKFVCLLPGNVLHSINLQNGSAENTPDVEDFAISGTTIITRSTGRSGVLKIIDNQGKVKFRIPHVRQWKLNPAKALIACITQLQDTHSVQLIRIGDGTQTTIEKSRELLHFLEWQEKGQGVAFLKNPDGTDFDRGAVCYYSLTKKKMHRFVMANSVHLPKTMAVGTSLTISEDGQRIFFYMDDTLHSPDKDAKSVQVWSTTDKDVYPAKMATDGWQGYSKVAVWFPDTGECRQLTDNRMPHLLLSGDQRHAITSDPLAYAPQFKQFSDRDYVITDLADGAHHLFLEQFSGNQSYLFVSPGGKYVTYFRNGSWWNYNIRKATHHKLVLPVQASARVNDAKSGSDDSSYFGIPGWDLDDSAVLLYDAYDIWKVAPDGSRAVRLTHGRETNTVFRFAKQSARKHSATSYDGRVSAQYDMTKPQYLTAYNEKDGKTGIFELMPGHKEKPLVYKDRRIDNFLIAECGKQFLFMEQDFDLSPQLVTGKLGSQKQTVVAKSNRQQASYYWGRSELITYRVMGKDMSGVLIYPANYSPDRKYPMVVDIYESQEKELHVYTIPHLPASIGFNATHYMLQDYFVYLPTIVPAVGDTGNSAMACLNAAIEKVLEIGSINKERMGLIGHSYGGFEANFIATQKHPFRTIVSGSGIIDLATNFLHVAWDYNSDDYWMYESGQMRMGKSLYEDRERYYRNSPVFLLEGVSVPMLIWTGADDRHVDAENSIKLYMALRRLRKQGVLLIYPDEKHVISNPKNQQDLRQKIEEWFAFHLKDGPIRPWMQSDYTGKDH